MEVAPSVSTRAALACALLGGGGAGRRRARAYLRGEFADRETEDAVNRALDETVPEVENDLARLGWRWTACGEESFPAALAALADPPLGLFHRGPLPEGAVAALVGARRATSYGREVAEYLGRELAAAGAWVVSGMARGVDAAAHRGALAAGGRTAAVWGCGPDRIYPPEHDRLAEEIGATGCLISEYPPGAAPLARHFPERNRIIAGLAQAVVVVEADERSGALITARLALEEGREVLAVPGSVFSRLSAGPNGLLRAGAAPVVAADDVLAVLGLDRAATRDEEVPPFLVHLEPGRAVSTDELAVRAGLPVASVLEALLQLELAGWVVRGEDGRYRRRVARPHEH